MALFATGYGGPLNWSQRTFDGQPILCGHQLSGAWESHQATDGLSGLASESITGGSVWHVTPQEDGAPLGIDTVSLYMTVDGSSEEDYYAVQRMHKVARNVPVPMWLPTPIEDVWDIPAVAKTTWTLSRSTAFGLVAYADYTPRAFIFDKTSFGTSDTLAIVGSSPTTSQLAVDDASNSTAVTTADISAQTGRILVFRYHPLIYVTIESISRSISTPNGLSFSMSLRDRPPRRVYS